jgi:hypothetical protein
VNALLAKVCTKSQFVLLDFMFKQFGEVKNGIYRLAFSIKSALLGLKSNDL